MLKIRLRRVGAKKQPSYRVVVADSRSPRDGRFVETIGFYNPRTEIPTVEIKEDRALYWLSHGAQPTESVAGLLRRLGTMDRLARLKRGEALDVLLSEAVVARQQLAEEALPSEAEEVEAHPEAEEVEAHPEAEEVEAQPEAEEVEAQQTAEVAGAEVAEAEMEAKEVVEANSEVSVEVTDEVINADGITESGEEEA